MESPIHQGCFRQAIQLLLLKMNAFVFNAGQGKSKHFCSLPVHGSGI
jgi:hypothetical protein